MSMRQVINAGACHLDLHSAAHRPDLVLAAAGVRVERGRVSGERRVRGVMAAFREATRRHKGGSSCAASDSQVP